MRYLEGVVLRAGGNRDPDVVDKCGRERSAVAALQLRVVRWQLHVGCGTPLQTGHNILHHKLAQGHHSWIAVRPGYLRCPPYRNQGAMGTHNTTATPSSFLNAVKQRAAAAAHVSTHLECLSLPPIH